MKLLIISVVKIITLLILFCSQMEPVHLTAPVPVIERGFSPNQQSTPNNPNPMIRYIFICPNNLDHIMPYRLLYVIFSDRAKIFFVVLLASHNPQNNIKKMSVCLSHLQSVHLLKYFWLFDCLLLPYVTYLNDSPWVFFIRFQF